MIRQSIALVTLFAFLLSPLRAAAPAAAEHLVPQQELSQRLQKAESQRVQDQADLERLFAHEQAQQALRSAGLDPVEVTSAIPQLDDETLAELAQKAREIESDVSGGLIGSLIILLLLVLALVIVWIVYVQD